MIIHVGTQKTGSSALQSYLSQHAGALRDQGVKYLDAGRRWGNRSSHGELAQSVLGRADMSVWEDVRAELAGSDSKINLISAEGFWFSDPAVLRNQLPNTGEVKIVVYLRRQDKYLQSLWKQAVTGGRKHDFASWRERLPFRGDYFSTLEQWAGQFGANSIVVRPYERNGVVNTVEDFCRIIGVTGLPEQQNVGRNPSPRKELLHFIRAFNHLKVDVDRHQFFRAVISKNSEYIRSCDLLSDVGAAELLESYSESNRQLVAKYYKDETTPLFPALTPGPALPAWDLGSEEFFKLTVDVLEVVTKFAGAPSGELKEGKARVPDEANGIPATRQKLKSERAVRKAGRTGREKKRGRVLSSSDGSAEIPSVT